MVIEFNRKDWLQIDRGRLLIVFFVDTLKPWHIRFNRMFAHCSRRIELVIWDNEKDMG